MNEEDERVSDAKKKQLICANESHERDGTVIWRNFLIRENYVVYVRRILNWWMSEWRV